MSNLNENKDKDFDFEEYARLYNGVNIAEVRYILDRSHISHREFLSLTSRSASLLRNKRKLDENSKDFVDIQLINALIGQIGKNAYIYLRGEYKNLKNEENEVPKNSNKKG